MSPDSHDAHYLHRRRGLTLLVKPPVRRGSGMVWDRKGNLLVGSAEGTIERVHPALGTSRLFDGLNPVIGLGMDGDLLVVVEAGSPGSKGGRWQAFDLSAPTGDAQSRRRLVGAHPFEGPVGVMFRGDRVLLGGLIAGEKQVLFYEQGRKVFRVRLPARAVAVPVGDALGLAQSAVSGLEVIALSDGARFQQTALTEHTLVSSGDHVMGLGSDGLRVWSVVDPGEGLLVPLPDVTAASLTPDGRFAAVGTRRGGVALVDLTDEADRTKPTTVHITEQPIRAVAVGPKGNVLASSADALTLWSWE